MVQELLRHKTLAMSMDLYTRINATNKREAVAKLSYGAAVPISREVAESVVPKDNRHDFPTPPRCGNA